MKTYEHFLFFSHLPPYPLLSIYLALYISYLLLLAFLIFLHSLSFFLVSHIFLTSSLSHFSCQTNVYTSNLKMQLLTNNVLERNKGNSTPHTISGQPNFVLGGYRPFVFT